MSAISGFSKLSKIEKINWISKTFFNSPDITAKVIQSFWHPEEKVQEKLDEFSENTITNFYMPYGVAPNFLINNKLYCVPMVVEESSVVAAASKSAKFWQSRGGFHTQIIGTKKVGQVHFYWNGRAEILQQLFLGWKKELFIGISHLSENMTARGGGVLDIELIDCNHLDANYFQLMVKFDTCDAMGANFINTILESLASLFRQQVLNCQELSQELRQIDIIMSILSNYTPDCRVKAWVECPIEQLSETSLHLSAREFAHRFQKAVRIAKMDPHRATTHNKGIFNGVDAVVLATGNDFRAVEACGHTFAARDGQYRGLSTCYINGEVFRFELELPLALGTVGGLTKLHPLANASLEMLGHPTSSELMMVAVAVGLAQNFAAIRSLVTTGIQKGHMKMHLLNILTSLGASENEREFAKEYFSDKIISYTAVANFVQSMRKQQ